VRGSYRAPILLAATLAVAVVVSAGWDSHTERPTNSDELVRLGERVYVEYCAECHQVHGTGWSTLYPTLAGNPIVTLNDPEPIILTVKYGQGSMTAFGERLRTDEIAAVLTYIRNSWGNQAPPVSKRQVQ
jgi:alcohol dehydrogenase (quinone), cytochrome c subunit